MTITPHPNWYRTAATVRPTTFPALMRELRRRRNLSQSEMSRTVGVAQTMLSRLELGKQPPSLDTCIRIADGLDLSATERWRLIEATGFRLTPKEDVK